MKSTLGIEDSDETMNSSKQGCAVQITRRRALARLGLTTALVYVAPVLLSLSGGARASDSGGGGASGGGKSGSGGADSGSGGDNSSSSDDGKSGGKTIITGASGGGHGNDGEGIGGTGL